MYCRHCGMLLPEPPTSCPRCGAVPGAPLLPTVPPPLPSPYAGQSPYVYAQQGDSAGMRLLLPVGRSIWAVIAGYMGLCSVLIFPAPLALIFGIVAIIDIKKHPERHGMGRAIFAIVMSIAAPAIVIGAIVLSANHHL